MNNAGLSSDLRGKYEDIALAIPREMRKHVVGANSLIDMLLITLLSGSGHRIEGSEESLAHILIESDVGEGKTFISKTFARTIGGSFSRIQFMRGLKPQQLRQAVRQLADGSLEFSEGPLNANIVLADELNRATDLTHGAMIDALAEGVVEVGGKEVKTPRPYMVIATGNSRDLQGISKLGTAMNDRLVFKVSSPVYTELEEVEIVVEQERRSKESVKVVCNPDDILALCDDIHGQIEVSPKIGEHIVRLLRRARDIRDINGANSADFTSHGASGHRPTIWLHRVAKVTAFLNERMYVIPDDVWKHTYSVLNHRIDFGYGRGKEEIENFIHRIIQEERQNAAGLSR